ncbi:MAG: glycosyltransferase [Bacillota bacterium]|nr:glycosyltransferase [Bacillota bacterium]
MEDLKEEKENNIEEENLQPKGKIDLSIVIIGRNEARHLPRLFQSLPVGKGIEWIYVDSASEDYSAEMALQYGARVFRVERESVCGPGTGRYIGTLEARGKWILYLDGDMALRQEFLPFLERVRAEKNLPQQATAFVGRTCNRYLDRPGMVVASRDYVVLPPQKYGPVDRWGKKADYHGGAVLYRKESVLEAGNWNPAVYQLEEIDLFCRIKAAGGILRAVDLPMADHYTPFLSLTDKIASSFFPRRGGKKFYGAGQVVAACLREGRLLQFIRCYPYPFIILAGLAAAIPLCFFSPAAALLINLAIAAWIGVSKKWYFYFVYLGNLLQIFYGISRYRPSIPQYRKLSE